MMSARTVSAWLESFFSEPRSGLLVRIDDDFLANNFNSFGIKQSVPHFNAAYQLLRKGGDVRSARVEAANVDPAVLSKEAEIIYGCLHARYLLTRPGQQLMMEKWKANAFEHCPRVLCRNVMCLPYGISEALGQHSVKFFCPGCNDVYLANQPAFQDMDGAYFGPNWVHVFVHNYQAQLVPKDPPRAYVPKIFGFRIYHEGHGGDELEYTSDSADV
jgi:casein kinase II subunit beta